MRSASPTTPDYTQEIRYARAANGARIAYAVAGNGYPLVRGTHWLTHVEIDWMTPAMGGVVAAYARRYRLYRYNPRGFGGSDGEVASSSDALVADLHAVVKAAGLERFALNGASGGALAAIAYAAQHPERVSHLILSGGYARGALCRASSEAARERVFATAKLIELGWGDDNPSIRQIFTTEFFPGATVEQMRSFNDLQRRSATPRQAAAMFLANQSLDVSDLLADVRCPTLVLHCQGDLRVPIEEARLIAASIPGARFVPLDSSNHVPLPGEPAFDRMFAEIEAFLPTESIGASNGAECSEVRASLTTLTEREREVLDLIARGRDNTEIAKVLGLAAKTVRNHITQIFAKLAVVNRAQAIVRAREAGLGR